MTSKVRMHLGSTSDDPNYINGDDELVEKTLLPSNLLVNTSQDASTPVTALPTETEAEQRERLEMADFFSPVVRRPIKKSASASVVLDRYNHTSPSFTPPMPGLQEHEDAAAELFRFLTNSKKQQTNAQRQLSFVDVKEAAADVEAAAERDQKASVEMEMLRQSRASNANGPPNLGLSQSHQALLMSSNNQHATAVLPAIINESEQHGVSETQSSAHLQPITMLAINVGPDITVLDERMKMMEAVVDSPTPITEQTFSRKVFVGGLPVDVNQKVIEQEFSRFGKLHADWPPPRKMGGGGYVFLIFDDETAVRLLIDSCQEARGSYWLLVNSPTMQRKPAQVRPWRTSDAIYYTQPLSLVSLRRTVFIGGVPRPIKAQELASIMDAHFGGVLFTSIDTDPDLLYPKGAARVVFDNEQSYKNALHTRFIEILPSPQGPNAKTSADPHSSTRVGKSLGGSGQQTMEIKPYMMEDSLCEECSGKMDRAAFFCASSECMQYYCAVCWPIIHSVSPKRCNHAPMVKQGDNGQRVMDMFRRRVMKMQNASPTSITTTASPGLTSMIIGGMAQQQPQLQQQPLQQLQHHSPQHQLYNPPQQLQQQPQQMMVMNNAGTSAILAQNGMYAMSILPSAQSPLIDTATSVQFAAPHLLSASPRHHVRTTPLTPRGNQSYALYQPQDMRSQMNVVRY